MSRKGWEGSCGRAGRIVGAAPVRGRARGEGPGLRDLGDGVVARRLGVVVAPKT